MRVKQDAIPGMEIPIWFEATMPTPEDQRWEIACAQLCGLGHYRMRGVYRIHDQAGYEAWMAEQVADQLGLPADEPAADEPAANVPAADEPAAAESPADELTTWQAETATS